MARQRTPKSGDLPPGRSQGDDPNPSARTSAVSISAHMTLGPLTLRGVLQLFKKPPKDHPLYAAVGRVAAEWAELEHRLDEIIWRLSGTSSPLASCITSQMIGHFPRFNAIIALVSLKRGSPELIKLIKAEQGRVSELAEARARRVHDAWYVDQDTGEPHQFQSMPRKELTFGPKPQATSDMDDLVKKIAQRIEAVGTLTEVILAELSPLPDK